jgi:hypothetical protein
MHFLSKLLRGITDESVHRAFLRYGKGEYDGPMVAISLTKTGKITVKSSYLIQDLLAHTFLQVVPATEVAISGVILGYEMLDSKMVDLGFDVPPFTKKRAMLLYQSKISGSYSREKLLKLYDEIGENAFIFCNLTGPTGWTHKSKDKIPSAQKEMEIKEHLKFGTTKTPPEPNFLELVLSELLPDFSGDLPAVFSNLRLINKYVIQDLEFPSNRDQLSSTEIRQQTKRKGIISRVLQIDEIKGEDKEDEKKWKLEFHRELAFIA